jgi:hypothetical protein
MRFPFKSLLILSERNQRVVGGTQTTTLYDLRNIGEHVFEAPSSEIWLHPIHLVATPLLALPVAGLALYIAAAFTDGEAFSMPWLVAILIAAPLALFYPLSLHGLLNRRMQAQARRERLLADAVPITVVRESDWEAFRGRLKQPDAVDKASALVARLAQRHRAQQNPAPLPNENAMEKWEERAGEAEHPPKESDKLTEQPGEIKPGASHPES